MTDVWKTKPAIPCNKPYTAEMTNVWKTMLSTGKNDNSVESDWDIPFYFHLYLILCGNNDNSKENNGEIDNSVENNVWEFDKSVENDCQK